MCMCMLSMKGCDCSCFCHRPVQVCQRDTDEHTHVHTHTHTRSYSEGGWQQRRSGWQRQNESQRDKHSERKWDDRLPGVCVCVSTGMRERPVSISLFFFNKSLYRVEVCVYRSGFVALWTLLEPWGTIAHPPHHTLPSWALSVLCVCASLSPFLCVSTSLLQLNSFAPLLFIFHSAPSGVSVPGVFQPVRG